MVSHCLKVLCKGRSLLILRSYNLTGKLNLLLRKDQRNQKIYRKEE